MSIKIENGFHVQASIEETWQLLNNIPLIVPCLPGAELTEMVDERNFKGVAKIKIGPVQLQFVGLAELYDVDDANHASRMRAKANDAKGRGNVQVDMAFRLTEYDAATAVHVVTELELKGSVAQYGRGAGLIKEIANQFTAQFARNFENLLAQSKANASGGNLTAETPSEATGPSASPPLPVRPAAVPVSAFSILFAALRAMLGRFFRIQKK
jgi:carbon monoxide dehydrogenase subunit G